MNRGIKVLSMVIVALFIVSTVIAAPVEVNRFNRTATDMGKSNPAIQGALNQTFKTNYITNALKDSKTVINTVADKLATDEIFAASSDQQIAYKTLIDLLASKNVNENTSVEDLDKIVKGFTDKDVSEALAGAVSYNDIITFINGKDPNYGPHEFDNTPETFTLAEKMKTKYAADLVELEIAGVKVFTLTSYGFANNDPILARIINESNIKTVSKGEINTVYFLPEMSWRAAYADNVAYVFDSLLPNISKSKDASVLGKRIDIGSKKALTEDQVVSAYRYILSHEAIELDMKAQQKGSFTEEQHAQLVAGMLQDPNNLAAAEFIDEVELKDNTERIINYLKGVFGNELKDTRILVSKVAAEQKGFMGVALKVLQLNGIDVTVVDSDIAIQNAVQDVKQVMFLDNSDVNKTAFTTAVKGSKSVEKSLYAVFDDSFLDKYEYQLAADKALGALLGDMALGSKFVTVDDAWAAANFDLSAISARLLDVSEKNNLTNAQIQKSISTFA